ncbi:MAG: exonuclease domain-containing protein [Methylotenera sp.]|uniref:exonuclease domain-containing protein n=1 Tax=Methylotenera sp. TaxID=2051956 RepID=UPI00248705A7|nr:exonuclease domain-containing protein [Methylotenera sp.]MDI1308162.1 exonuclease domain-containing protein [Methylotenera sp.]
MFIDTETTGLSKSDQPISVGAVLAEVDTRNGVILKEIARYYGLREPSCVITEGAYQVHGISDYQVKNKEFDLKELVTMFEVANLIVAHNAAFDKRMLSFMSDAQPTWGCSCRDIDWPDEIGGRSLDAISKHFSLNRPVIHNSLSDTLVMIEALQQKKADGSTYLLNHIRKHRL